MHVVEIGEGGDLVYGKRIFYLMVYAVTTGGTEVWESICPFNKNIKHTVKVSYIG